MLIQKHSNKLETNVENETQNFGIGDASVVIEILRNRLYEHKVRTLVQEYICNARDAMREVGKGNGFEVTVPTQLNPAFKVRDFGPGISPERMRDVFVMYGSSTKRGTNNQTGGFGIGAKSAWSYTDSFTIVSIVDGVRRTYVAHTGVNNNGRLDLVSTDKTDDCNGTEIQVAVKPHDINEFRSAAFRAIYFWDEKPTLKGELDLPTLVRGTKVSELVEVVDRNILPEYVRTRSYSDEALAVIDGIPYAINEKMIHKIEKLQKLGSLLKKDLILHFGNGVVEVSASREAIADSKHTIASLEKLASKALTEVKTYITDAFKGLKTTSEYLQTYATMSQSFDVDNFAKFGDYTIQQNWIKSPLLKKVKLTLVHCLGKRGRHRVEKITRHELSEAKKEIEVTKFNSLFFISKTESNVQQNKRIREYFKTNTAMILIEPLLVIEYDNPVVGKDGQQTQVIKSKTLDMVSYNQVLKDLSAKDFSSITYVDPPKVEKAKVKREDAEICLHTFGGSGRHTYTTLASNIQKWFYLPMTDGQWPTGFDGQMLKGLEDYLKKEEDARICGLAERAQKMVAGNSNFLPLTDWLKNYAPTKGAILYAKNQAADNREVVLTLSALKDIEDSFLQEMIKEYKNLNRDKIVQVPELLIKKLNNIAEVKEFKEKDEKLTKLIKNEYPLVSELGRYSSYKAELAFYINAKYNTNKKGK